MIRPLTLLLCILLLSTSGYAQKDTLALKKKNKSFIKEAIVPLSLIAGGSLISRSQFEKNFQRDIRNLVGNRYNTQVDNYTRYVPLAEILIADAIGVESKNHWFDQAKNWTIAWYVTDLLTFKLKRWIGKPRPDNFDNFSLPSGHTSFAFMNAEVLYNEFKDSSPWFAHSGYLFAATTGGLRVANNAHFISDVLVGAGLGILVTKLVYWLDPIISWNPFKKVKGVTFFPQRFDDNHVGFYLSVRL